MIVVLVTDAEMDTLLSEGAATLTRVIAGPAVVDDVTTADIISMGWDEDYARSQVAFFKGPFWNQTVLTTVKCPLGREGQQVLFRTKSRRRFVGGVVSDKITVTDGVWSVHNEVEEWL